jgi:hypothetical protein
MVTINARILSQIFIIIAFVSQHEMIRGAREKSVFTEVAVLTVTCRT